MSWVEQTISEFGASVGIDALSLNDAGVVTLQFEQLGTLYIERRNEEILIYLVRDVEHPDAALFRRVLSCCHHQHHHPFPVHAGLRGETSIVFLIRMPEADFILPNLERAMNLLDQLHSEVLAVNS